MDGCMAHWVFSTADCPNSVQLQLYTICDDGMNFNKGRFMTDPTDIAKSGDGQFLLLPAVRTGRGQPISARGAARQESDDHIHQKNKGSAGRSRTIPLRNERQFNVAFYN
ncbi:hypothetical protein J6590_054489 [Homalodisca vitripennis]|nr:hypothetical protein J6590_054489 [Homalodisca vitripennis]